MSSPTPPTGPARPRRFFSRSPALLACLLLAVLPGGAASCVHTPPEQVAPAVAPLHLEVQVRDVDPLVIGDCTRSVTRALERRGFRPRQSEEGVTPPGMKVDVEVMFPDGYTADATATLHPVGSPVEVLASSRTGYFEPAYVDLRFRSGKYRVQNCEMAADRLAAAVAEKMTGLNPPPTPPAAPAPHRLTHQDLRSPLDQRGFPAGAKLTPAAVDADLDRLTYALDRGYSGRKFTPDKAWAAMLRDLRALRGKATTVGGLCNAIGDALWHLPDAHLSARRSAERGDIQCGTSFETAARKPGVGPAYLSAEPDKVWAAEAVTVGHATFGVIAIQHFAFKDDPVWEGFPRAIAELSHTDGLVIDLRGNGGGDDSRGYELAETLRDSKVRTGAERVHARRAPETLTLLLNTYDAAGRQPDGTLAPFLADRYRTLEKERDAAARSTTPEWATTDLAQTPLPPPGPKAYAAPIAILVDAACASSCESTLEVLRLHPRAKVFGERTAGYIHFGDVGRVRLPGSTIHVHIPTTYSEYPGGKLYDKIGFAPDVAVPPGDDAFAAAMTWTLAQTPKSRIEKPADYVVPEPTRDAEKKRLETLGLSPGAGSPVLEKPFAAPYTRRSFVVPQAWLLRRPPRRVHAPALLADLDALQEVLSRAYAGYRTAEKRGWDWNKWLAAWRDRLRTAGPAWLPTRDAFDEVRKLQETQLDNHTTLPLRLSFGGSSRTWILTAKPSAPCTAVRDKDGTITDIPRSDAAQSVKEAKRFDGKDLSPGHYLVRPSNHKEPTAVQCGATWIPLRAPVLLDPAQEKATLQALSGRPEDRPSLRRLTPEVAYLRLPTFSKQNSEIIAREQPSWDKPAGTEKVLLVDLRGNDGGDAAMGALAGWVPDSELKDAFDFTKRTGASCLYPALRWGYASLSSWGLAPPLSDGLRKGLQSGLDKLFEKDDPACPAKVEEHRARKSYRDKTTPRTPPKGRPRIAVLVDARCGSDCELMAFALQKLAGTRVAGVNTFGVIQHIQPGYSALPNTRLPFRVALGTSDVYGDGRSTDGYGLDVDVLIDGEDGWKKDGLLALAGKLAAGE